MARSAEQGGWSKLRLRVNSPFSDTTKRRDRRRSTLLWATAGLMRRHRAFRESHPLDRAGHEIVHSNALQRVAGQAQFRKAPGVAKGNMPAGAETTVTNTTAECRMGLD